MGGPFSNVPIEGAGGGGGAGVSGLVSADGGVALADNTVVRGDSTDGIQGSDVTIADAAGSSVAVATTAGNALAISATAPTAAAGASQAGKNVSVTASAATASTDTAGAAAGGAVSLTGGAAARNASGNANGGAVSLTGGAGIGTGTTGAVVLNTALTVEAPAGNIQRVTVSGSALDIGTSTGNNLRLLANNTAHWLVNQATGNFTDASGSTGEVTLVASAATATAPNHSFIGDEDSGVGRAAADQLSLIAGGVEGIRFSEGVTGQSDGITYRVVVDTNTASPITVVATMADIGKWFCNTGAGGSITANLPAAAVGLHYGFAVTATQDIVITANGTDTIRIAGTASTAGGTATNGTIGSTIYLMCFAAGEWLATAAPNGTWTLSS